MATFRGLDLSYCQPNVDFKAVKSQGYNFVILRAGYGRAINYPNQYDPTFEKHYANAKAAGLNVGAYWYSYAISADDAKLEAQSFIKALKGKQLEYPVFFDMEEASQFNKGKAFCDSIVNAFCTEMQNNGYYAGVYCSTYWYTNYVSPNVREKYTCWIADWSTKCSYTGTYGMWQNGTAYINGTGYVDHDISYVDYPTIIKNGGYNGFTKPVAAPSPATPTKKSVDEIAKEVIAGLWGAGDDRKKKLIDAGYNYDEVQKKVNEILGIKTTTKPTTSTTPPKKTIDTLAKEVLTGKWGAGEERKKKLTEAGYDYNKVQAKVNEILNTKSKTTTKSITEIAKEVIAGKWGAGLNRKKKLESAGYNYIKVQEEVNRLLKK